MTKLFTLPTPGMAKNDTTNSINQIVLKLQEHLKPLGYSFLESAKGADLVVGHAGQTDGKASIQVAHCHGLYPTYLPGAPLWWTRANAHVIQNLRTAEVITVPSPWVGDLLARDMHIRPFCIGWGINPEEWFKESSEYNYVLWNKTRPDIVCDPTPLEQLAALVPGQLFLTTFGGKTPNVKSIGRVPFEEMKHYIQKAQVYLATTKETFGIGTLEAMACGIPVLGYSWGATESLVEHGVTGYLTQPGNIQGLKQGLEYCLAYRDILGANARSQVKRFSWEDIARVFDTIYQGVLGQGPSSVSVVIPLYNYGHFLKDCLDTVSSQLVDFRVEVIIVDDGSTDNSLEIARNLTAAYDHRGSCSFRVISQENRGVAEARNRGIRESTGSYIVCLDPDDQLGNPEFLQTLRNYLDLHRDVGIVYTGLAIMDAEGRQATPSSWPSKFYLPNQLIRKNQVPTCCMFRKDLWTRSYGYLAQFTPAEDANLWTQLISLGYRAHQVTQEPWFKYRLHGTSLSSSVRRGETLEPDWLDPFTWIHTQQIPFALPVDIVDDTPKVRNYDQPKVSVIIPVGPGHEDLVKQAILSVESQEFWDWELIVINDTGNSLDLSYAPYAKVLMTSGRIGPAKGRNLGVKLAKSPYIVFLDADDTFTPDAIKLLLEGYMTTGYYSYSDWYDSGGEICQAKEYSPTTIFQESSIHSIVTLLPKIWFEEVGGFDTTLEVWEDVDLYLKLATRGYCGHRVPHPLFVYNYSTGQRRNYGETIKSSLIGEIRRRYGEYIQGEKVCNCIQPKGKLGYNLGDGDFAMGTQKEMVRVQYHGAVAPHEVVGSVTHQNYGRRSDLDIFLVWVEDVDESKFSFLPEILPPTFEEIPPPPPIIFIEPELEPEPEPEPEEEEEPVIAKQRGRPKKS